MNTASLRICIDARLISSGESGGVEQFIIGLASGLSGLTDGTEEYLFLSYPGHDEWLKPYIDGNCRILHCSQLPSQLELKRKISSEMPFLKMIWDYISPIVKSSFKVPVSDGTIERANMDVMHFTFQGGFLTKVPSLYHPHDLQHVHLPQLFTPRQKMARDILYNTLCQQAKIVPVVSSWVKEDLTGQYKIPKDKIKVIPFAPPLDAYTGPTNNNFEEIRRKFDLPEQFIFYPAQTWPHKNHIGILLALAYLRDQYNMLIPFVSSGFKNSFYKSIEKCIIKSHLESQVKFLGFLDPLELQAIYRLSRCVVIPTKFEAASFPLWEAFRASIPVACSNVTSLPAQAGDAAVIFNPDKTEEIADAIYRLWTDEKLRNVLIENGLKNVQRFSWEKTAKVFRTYYRLIAKQSLEEEDITYLNEQQPLL
jgi:glycosyltransferase involved in cell wall biosynthesis